MGYYATTLGTERQMRNRKLNNHFLLSIIDDVFEDFLEAKGVVIENADRDLEDGSANIYGEDFDIVMESLRETCEQHGIHVEDSWN